MYMIARIFPVLFLFLAVFFSWSASQASGYRAFGVFYQQSDTEYLTSSEIARLNEAGITWLMVEEALPESLRAQLRGSGFSLYVMVPEYYSTPKRLLSPAYRYFERADALFRHYRNDPSVKGFGLFAYGNWRHPTLPNRLHNLGDTFLAEQVTFTLDPRPFPDNELHPFDGTVMLTRNAGQLESQLANNSKLAGILYAPVERNVSIRDFQDVMKLLDSRRDLPVFFHREWFIRNSAGGENQDTNLAQITDFYNRVSDARLANPAPDTFSDSIDFSVILLLALWVFFATVYRFNPVYRKSIERFFLNYDFMVNDVLMRRIRLTGESAIIFVMSAFISGTIAYAIAELYLGPVSRQAIMYHIWLIPAGWNHPIVFFSIFFFLAAVVQAIQVTWLRVANGLHAQTYQIATFILWPQHLNLIFVTIGIILLRAFPSEHIAIPMILLYWSIALASFFLAAYNMRRIHPTSPLYMLLTYVLYILVSAAILSWLVYGLDIYAAWGLSNSLASF